MRPLEQASRSAEESGCPRWRAGDPPRHLHRVLDRGGVLAIPTFAGYGLAADPLSQVGVDEIYQIKQRAADKPLPVVASSLGQFEALGADFSTPGLRSLVALWPAPLTIVVALARPIPATAEGSSLGVRIPDHPELAELLETLGRPLTATSANRSGADPCLDPIGLDDLLIGYDAVIVDVGRLPAGNPSTVVRVDSDSGVTVLRQGRYPERHVFDAFQSTNTPGVISAVSVEIPADDSR